jgi:hypothetical protein
VPGQFGEALLEFGQGNRARAGDMARPIFFGRTHIENGHLAAAHAPKEFVSIHGLHGAPRLAILPPDLFDLRQTGFAQAPQVEKEPGHVRLGQLVGHIPAGLLGVDEARAAKDLEVMGRIGQALSGVLRENLNGARPL